MGAKILASALQRCQFLLFTYDLRCMNTINIVGATYGWMTKPWRVSSDYLCLMELLVSLLQKRHPLPLSPQNYPLHGSEVNGFHSAPTTYNHTPTINGEGIMGKEKSTYHTSIFVVSVRFSSHGHLIYFCFVFFFFPPKNKLTGHLTHIIYFVSAANRGTTAGSSGDEIGKALASVSSFLFVVGFLN